MVHRRQPFARSRRSTDGEPGHDGVWPSRVSFLLPKRELRLFIPAFPKLTLRLQTESLRAEL